MPETATLSENPKRRSAKPDLRKPAPLGDNGPTREDVLFFAGQFEKAEQVIKDARTAKKRLRQRAVIQGIRVEVLDDALEEKAKNDDTTIDRLVTFKRYAEFMSLPVGGQLNFFDAPPAKKEGNGASSREALLKKAYDDGYEFGVMGRNRDEQAYPPFDDTGQENMRGWNDGQAVLKDKLLKHNEEVAAIEAAEAAKKAKKDKKAEAAAEAPDDQPTKH